MDRRARPWVAAARGGRRKKSRIASCVGWMASQKGASRTPGFEAVFQTIEPLEVASKRAMAEIRRQMRPPRDAACRIDEGRRVCLLAGVILGADISLHRAGQFARAHREHLGAARRK